MAVASGAGVQLSRRNPCGLKASSPICREVALPPEWGLRDSAFVRDNGASMHTKTSRALPKKTTLAAAFGLALLGTTVMTPAPALAEEKIALVVGNSQYRKVTKLINPANDSADIASSLTRLGFSVKHLKDLDFDAFRRAIIEFGTAAKTADMAVIFYAGHGAEIDGKNWLIPVDAEIKSEINVYA